MKLQHARPILPPHRAGISDLAARELHRSPGVSVAGPVCDRVAGARDVMCRREIVLAIAERSAAMG